MTLTELQYLTTLAQEQHFGHAARRCRVSQPALSNAIKKLEAELDTALFIRTRSGISVTAVGEQVIAQANRVLQSAAAIEDIARGGSDHLGSPLAVGAIFTAGPYLLPQCIPHLQQPTRRLELQTEQAPTHLLRHKLRQGQLDAIIVSLPFTEVDVVTQILFEEPLLVLMPQTHPLAVQAAIDPHDLNERNMLLLDEGHCLRDQVLALCPHLSASLAGRSTGSTLETLRNMVIHGQGVTVVPLSAAATLCAGQHNLATRPFSNSAPGRTLALAWRASFPRYKAIEVLRRALQACSHGYYTSAQEPQGHGLLVDNSHW